MVMREASVARHHSPDVQVFQPDEAVFFNQLAAELVMKVAALIGNPLIQPRQAQACLFPVAPAQLLPGSLARKAATFLLCFAVVLRRSDFYSG